MENEFCLSCSKHAVCKSICPELELTLAQEDDGFTETSSCYYDQDRDEFRVYYRATGREVPLLSERDKRLVYLLFRQTPRAQIAAELGVTRAHLNVLIQRLNEKGEKIRSWTK